MTCREFNQKAELLSLAELQQWQDKQFLQHVSECPGCGSWLQQRHVLANGLDALKNSTASREAPVAVEYAVMRAFRKSHAPAAAIEEARPSSFAFRLSRFFEMGAYAAVAAALAIGMAVGVWFWHQRTPAASQTPSANSAQVQPAQVTPAAEETKSVTAEVSTVAHARPRVRRSTSAGSKGEVRANATNEETTAQIEQTNGYQPLMLCDPLSCTGGEQVVRVELPASEVDPSRDSSQPLMADVVIGDDGLVRAIRIVQ